VKQFAKALTSATGKPVIGGRLYPDGSFGLFVGDPLRELDPDVNPLDCELAEFEARKVAK
jgi:hypothetical protein